MKLLLVSLLLIFSMGANAATKSLSAPVINWQMCSQAEVRAFVIFSVAHAQLYRQYCPAGQLPLTPPLMLVFRYSRDVPADAFQRSSVHMIKKNLSAQAYASLSTRIANFNRGYRNTQDGDVYRLEYRHDGRFLLYFNGQQVASEKGDDFAHAYLSIWFGTEPYSNNLKQALLTPAPKGADDD